MGSTRPLCTHEFSRSKIAMTLRPFSLGPGGPTRSLCPHELYRSKIAMILKAFSRSPSGPTRAPEMSQSFLEIKPLRGPLDPDPKLRK